MKVKESLTDNQKSARMVVERALKSSLKRNKRYLLAVSGGLDSMVLLHALHHCNPLSGELSVAHVNHGLRSEATADARVVAEVVARLGLPFYSTVLEDPPESNVEHWGRVERYRFFRTLAETHRFDAVLTAHHSDDVAETFLMRLFANKELGTIESEGFRGAVLRPFLKLTRSELDHYAKVFEVPFVHDASNDHDRFTRNRIRNQIVPSIRDQFGEASIAALASRAQEVASDHEALNLLAQSAVAPLSQERPLSREWWRSLVALVNGQPEGLVWRVVHFSLLDAVGHRLGRHHCKLVAEFMRSNAAEIQLPGFVLRRKGGGVEVIANDLHAKRC